MPRPDRSNYHLVYKDGDCRLFLRRDRTLQQAAERMTATALDANSLDHTPLQHSRPETRPHDIQPPRG